MKLLKTEIKDGCVEMLYADGPDPETAKTMLYFQMPVEEHQELSLAHHRAQALHELRNAISPEIQEIKRIAGLAQ